MIAEPITLIVLDFKTRLIAEGVPLRRVVVFGSQARGDADEDSDIDVLVLIDGPADYRTRKKVYRCAIDAGYDTGDIIQPVTMNFDEFEHGIERASLLAMAVRAEGIEV